MNTDERKYLSQEVEMQTQALRKSHSGRTVQSLFLQ